MRRMPQAATVEDYDSDGSAVRPGTRIHARRRPTSPKPPYVGPIGESGSTSTLSSSTGFERVVEASSTSISRGRYFRDSASRNASNNNRSYSTSSSDSWSQIEGGDDEDDDIRPFDSASRSIVRPSRRHSTVESRPPPTRRRRSSGRAGIQKSRQDRGNARRPARSGHAPSDDSDGSATGYDDYLYARHRNQQLQRAPHHPQQLGSSSYPPSAPLPYQYASYYQPPPAIPPPNSFHPLPSQAYQGSQYANSVAVQPLLSQTHPPSNYASPATHLRPSQPRPPYRRPYSEEGQWLAFDVLVRSDPNDVYRSATADGAGSPTFSRCILAATQDSSEASVTIDLSCREYQADWKGPKWVHYEDANPTVEKLERIVRSLPGVSEAEALIAGTIFYDLRAKSTDKMTYSMLSERTHVVRDTGFKPATVSRYDSKAEFRSRDEHDGTVTLLTVPYFLTRSNVDVPNQAYGSLRTLLQAYYPYEDASERDRSQVYTTYTTQHQGNVLCVSQMVLMTFTNVLLTVAGLPAAALRGESIKHTDIEPEQCHPVVLHVTTPTGDVVHIDIHPIPPYLDLRELIRARCFPEESIGDDEFALFFSDSTELDASRWLSRIETETSLILELIVCKVMPPLPFYPMSGMSMMAVSPIPAEPPGSMTYYSEPPLQDRHQTDNTRSSRHDRRLQVRFDAPDDEPPRRRNVNMSQKGSRSPAPSSYGGVAARTESQTPYERSISYDHASQSSQRILSADAQARDPIIYDPTYLYEEKKPEIYQLSTKTLRPDFKTKSPSLGEPAQTGADAGLRGASPSTHNGLAKRGKVEPQMYQWGFTWGGLDQSELRPEAAPVFLMRSPSPQSMSERGSLRSTSNGVRTKCLQMARAIHHPSESDTSREGPKRRFRQPHGPSVEMRSLDGVLHDNHPTLNFHSDSPRSPGPADPSSSRVTSDEERDVPVEKGQSSDKPINGSEPRKQLLIEYHPISRAGSVASQLPVDSDSPDVLDPSLRQTYRSRTRRLSSHDSSSHCSESHSFARGASHDSISGPITGAVPCADHEETSTESRYDGIHGAVLPSTHESSVDSTAETASTSVWPVESSSDDEEHSDSTSASSQQPTSDASGSHVSAAAPNDTSSHREETPEDHSWHDRRSLYLNKVPLMFAWGAGSRKRDGPNGRLSEEDLFTHIMGRIHDKLHDELTKDGSRKTYRKALQVEYRQLTSSSNTYALDSGNAALCLTDTEFGRIVRSVGSHFDRVESLEGSDLPKLWLSGFGHTCQTVELFLPADSKGHPLKKIWGALDRYQKAFDHENLHPNSHPTSGARLWLIRSPQQCEQVSRRLSVASPFAHRSSCRCVGRTYTSQIEVIEHLRHQHYQRHDGTLPRYAILKHFVTTSETLHYKKKLDSVLLIIERLHMFLVAFHTQAEDIMLSVASTSQRSRPQLQLTVALTNSFEGYVTAHTQAALLVDRISRHYRDLARGRNVNVQAFEEDSLDMDDQLFQHFEAVLFQLQEAHREMIILSRTNAEIKGVEIATVGLPSIVAGILSNVQTTVFEKGDDVVKQYELCVSRLQYQVNQSPRKKLLHHIHQLGEELAAVRQTIEQSKVLLRNYSRTLRPESYRRCPASRETLFPTEEAYLQKTFQVANKQLQALDVLDRRVQELADQVKRSVEVLEEDHGKAILTFTIITTIFLPLSFITGFFGMNTADIRSMNGGQGVFWTAALPFTAIIASVTLLMAFRGGEVIERIGPKGSFWMSLRQHVRAMRQHSFINQPQGVRRSDTEKTFESGMSV